MAGPTNLDDLAQTLLEAVEAAYATDGVTLPARRYRTIGQPVGECVATGSLVSTVAGARTIESIEPGEMVYGWLDGQLVQRPVTAVRFSGRKRVVRVRTSQRTLRATGNHPVLRLRRAVPERPESCLVPGCQRSFFCRGFCNTHDRAWRQGRLDMDRPAPQDCRRYKWSLAWVRIDELRSDDWIVILDHLPDVGTEQELSDGTPVSYEVAWLLGLFLADGSTHLGCRYVDLCVYGELADKAEAVIRSTWSVGRIARSREHGMRIFSKHLEVLLRDAAILSQRSKSRVVPRWVWGLSNKGQRAFLDGYTDGDGHRMTLNGRPTVQFAAASEELVRGLRNLCVAMGEQITNVVYEQRGHQISIAGRPPITTTPLWRFTWYPEGRRQGGAIELEVRGGRIRLPDRSFSVQRVRDIKDDGEADTWDLSVEGARSFIADGVLVHNCDSMCVAFDRIFIGAAGFAEAPQPVTPSLVRSAQFTVWVFRCVPGLSGEGLQVQQAPAVADLNASATEIMTDAYVVHRGLARAKLAGDLRDYCEAVSLGPGLPVEPEGGIGGCQTQVVLELS